MACRIMLRSRSSCTSRPRRAGHPLTRADTKAIRNTNLTRRFIRGPSGSLFLLYRNSTRLEASAQGALAQEVSRGGPTSLAEARRASVSCLTASSFSMYACVIENADETSEVSLVRANCRSRLPTQSGKRSVRVQVFRPNEISAPQQHVAERLGRPAA